MSTLAVFIALGGSSYAALSITGQDVRDGSLTARDLRRDSLGGGRIKESGLGVVPRARNAARLGGVRAADFLVRCPRDTVPVSDVCVETAPRPSASYTSAAGECERTDRRRTLGRRLPGHDELLTAIGDYGITLAPGGELTHDVYPSATVPGGLNVLYLTDGAGSVALTTNNPAGAKQFRCVTDPLN
jgi:hypothetical protein